MLIILDDSLIECDFTKNHALRSIEKILSTGIDGIHYVIATSYKLIDHFLGNNDLSRFSKDYLNSIRRRFSTEGALINSNQAQIIVKYFEPEASLKTEGNKYIVHINSLRNDEIRPTTLLCENHIDTEIYIHAAHIYTKSNKLKWKIFIEKDAGGGSQTHVKFQYCTANINRPVICVLDSDKLSPTSARGETAKSCLNVKKIEERPSISTIEILEARELENIIPREFFHQITPRHNHLSYLTSLDYQYYLYSDLKNAVSASWLWRLPSGRPERIFWDSFIANHNIFSQITCTNNTCASENQKKCFCVIIPNWGSNVSELTYNWLNENFRKATETKTTSSDWEIIGKKIAEWGYARGKLYC